MDKLAIEDGGAVSVRGEKVDEHDDLHLVVEGEPPVDRGVFYSTGGRLNITRQGRSL